MAWRWRSPCWRGDNFVWVDGGESLSEENCVDERHLHVVFDKRLHVVDPGIDERGKLFNSDDLCVWVLGQLQKLILVLVKLQGQDFDNFSDALGLDQTWSDYFNGLCALNTVLILLASCAVLCISLQYQINYIPLQNFIELSHLISANWIFLWFGKLIFQNDCVNRLKSWNNKRKFKFLEIQLFADKIFLFVSTACFADFNQFISPLRSRNRYLQRYWNRRFAIPGVWAWVPRSKFKNLTRFRWYELAKFVNHNFNFNYSDW